MHPVSVLIIHPRETQNLWSRTAVRTERNKKSHVMRYDTRSKVCECHTGTWFMMCGMRYLVYYSAQMISDAGMWHLIQQYIYIHVRVYDECNDSDVIGRYGVPFEYDVAMALASYTPEYIWRALHLTFISHLYDMWYPVPGKWYVINGIICYMYVIHGVMCDMICDVWYVMYDMWHIMCDLWYRYLILHRVPGMVPCDIWYLGMGYVMYAPTVAWYRAYLVWFVA